MNIKAYNSNIITNFFKIILFSIPILFVLGSFYVNLIAFLFSIFFFINFYKIQITFDKKDYIIIRGYRDYSKVYKNIKEVFDRSVN